MENFKSTHNLPFEVAPHVTPLEHGAPFLKFRIGTCEGVWRYNEGAYEVLAVINKKLGNGHFQDVFDWFENNCKRDKATLKFLHVVNPALHTHLIEKRGFEPHGEDSLIKPLNKIINV